MFYTHIAYIDTQIGSML